MRRWRPHLDEEVRHRPLVNLINRLSPEWLAATVPGGTRTVPHVRRDGAGDQDQELLDILGRDALSGGFRLRPLRGALVAQVLDSFVPDLDRAGGALADATQRLMGGGAELPRVARFEFEPATARVRRAVIVPGRLSETEPLPPDPVSNQNYLTFLAERGDRAGGFSGPGVSSLLFALARHACRLADVDAAVRVLRPRSVVAAKVALEPDVVDAVASRPSTTMPRLLARPAREVVAPELPAGTDVAEFLATFSLAEVDALGLPHVSTAYRRAAGPLCLPRPWIG
jgi:hypothetical protein